MAKEQSQSAEPTSKLDLERLAFFQEKGHVLIEIGSDRVVHFCPLWAEALGKKEAALLGLSARELFLALGTELENLRLSFATASEGAFLMLSREEKSPVAEVFDVMTTAGWFCDLNGRIRRSNHQASRLTQWSQEEMSFKVIQDLLPGATGERLAAESRQLLSEGKPVLNSVVSHKIGDRLVWARIDKVPSWDSNGTLRGFYVFVTDITQQKQAETRVLEEKRKLMALARVSQALHSMQHEEETYWLFMSLFPHLFPQSSGCLFLNHGQAGFELVSLWGGPEQLRKIDTLSELLQQCTPMTDLSHLPGIPEVFCLSLRKGLLAFPIRAGKETLAYLALELPDCPCTRDEITSLLLRERMTLPMALHHYALCLSNLRLRADLVQASVRDPLTGLFNRRHMEAALQREAKRAKRRGNVVSMVMLDIDHFKRINDSYGHVTGDRVLESLGRILLKGLRGEDIACRYGGEEFLIILPETDIAEAQHYCERLCVQLRQNEIIPGHRITISCGLSALQPGGETAAALEKADQALYEAKRNGRDQVVAIGGLVSKRGQASANEPEASF